MAIASPTLSSMKSGSKFADLRRRLIFLVLALLVFRIGAHIPVPGIDQDLDGKVRDVLVPDAGCYEIEF